MDGRALFPSGANGVHTYILGDEVVLFSTHAQHLYRLNATAGFIWQCLIEHLAEHEISQALVDAFGISAETARDDVAGIIQDWCRLGLFSGDQGVSDPDGPGTPQDSHPTSSLGDASYILPTRRQMYRLIDTRIAVGCSDAQLEQWLAPVLQHLSTNAEAPADICFDVVATPEGLSLLRDSVAIVENLRQDQIAPYVHAEILLAAYNAIECFIAMHSAAVCRNGRCVLLPGVSGSGKSTLAAALAGSGFEYCTDELTLITRQPYGVRPVPISLGIKEGSWSALEDYFPGIKELPCHVRRDLKRVRYMPPPKSFRDDHAAEGLPIQCVIFPTYQKNVSAVAQPISPADALCRIADAGYDISGRLNAAFVSELVAWVGGLACYELHYSSLQDAIEQVKGLVE